MGLVGGPICLQRTRGGKRNPMVGCWKEVSFGAVKGCSKMPNLSGGGAEMGGRECGVVGSKTCRLG